MPQRACTPLHLAAENCHSKVVETLIRAGADINALNRVSNVINCQLVQSSCID